MTTWPRGTKLILFKKEIVFPTDSVLGSCIHCAFCINKTVAFLVMAVFSVFTVTAIVTWSCSLITFQNESLVCLCVCMWVCLRVFSAEHRVRMKTSAEENIFPNIISHLAKSPQAPPEAEQKVLEKGNETKPESDTKPKLEPIPQPQAMVRAEGKRPCPLYGWVPLHSFLQWGRFCGSMFHMWLLLLMQTLLSDLHCLWCKL